MFSFLKTLIKIFLLFIFFYGISRIEINNRKVYDHVEAFAARVIGKYRHLVDENVTSSIKRRLAGYLKNGISKILDDREEASDRKGASIKNQEADMDENLLKRILESSD